MWWLLLIFGGTMGAVLGLAELNRRRAMQRRADRLSTGGWLNRDSGTAMGAGPGSKIPKSEKGQRDFLQFVTQMLAIQVVGHEMPDPIAEEFRRAVAESNLGVPSEQALGRMVERVPSYDLDLVVTAVNIQLQVGGNLAQILDTIAATIRERVRNQREIAALTAEGKLSGWVCVGMPPIMCAIMTALNPEYMKPLFTESYGLMIIGVAVGLQLVGGLVIKKMLSIDV